MKQPYEKHILHGMGYDPRKRLLESLKAAMQIIFGLMALLAIYGWMGERDAHAASLETQRAAFTVIEQCLGEKPGVVKIGDEHFMCSAQSMGVFK